MLVGLFKTENRRCKASSHYSIERVTPHIISLVQSLGELLICIFESLAQLIISQLIVLVLYVKLSIALVVDIVWQEFANDSNVDTCRMHVSTHLHVLLQMTLNLIFEEGLLWGVTCLQ